MGFVQKQRNLCSKLHRFLMETNGTLSKENVRITVFERFRRKFFVQHKQVCSAATGPAVTGWVPQCFYFVRL
jgi:hypothetical protein